MELDEAIKQSRAYKENLCKVYAFLWEKCAKSMQNKLASRSNFESDIFNNPINLRKAVKEHLLNFQEPRYKMSIISDALKSLVSTRQKDDENLQDYTRHFRTSKEIFESDVR